MQKLIVSILCILIITGSAYAKGTSKFKQGVYQYKVGNYIGCTETMKEVVNADPGNAVAHYYLAIAYVQIGNKDEAIKEYNSVITLNPKSRLIDYARQGLGYLGAAVPAAPVVVKPLPQVTSVPKEETAKDFMSDKVKETIREKDITKVINDANNNNGQVDPETLKRLDNFSNKKSENKTPTKEQIAQAMQILSSAGMSQAYNPEAMEMNMLMSSFGGQNMSGSGYNPMSSMLPMMMMAQGSNQKMDPQLIETMMSTMMMPSMMQLGGGNNDNNY